MTISAPPVISGLPTPPDPNDRATYNVRAYPWSVAQGVLATEVADVASNVYQNALEAAALATTASAQVALASAAANYKGPWSALAGALAMPASVSHNGNYWALNANLANVATATPGVSASWQPLNVGAGGAAETSSAVDITLTAASYRVQAVAMTAADKSVTLPDATTLSTGGELFVIKNTGALVFLVRDSAGGIITTLDPDQIAMLYLSNASTVAGSWHVGRNEANALVQTIYQATALTVNAAASTYLSVTPLSATQAIAVWATASAFNACTLNISGNTVTAGAVYSDGSVAPLWMSVAATSSTQAVATYQGTSGYLNARTLNVSGTTITSGAVLAVNAVASVYSAVTAMSSTQAIVAYSGTSAYTQACTLNISGTTLTAGAILSVNALNTSFQCVAALSSTQAIVGYSSAGEGVQVATLNVSGTTLTAGTIVTLTSAALGRWPSICGLSPTQAAISYTGPTPQFNMQTRVLNVSGADIAAGPILPQAVTPVDSVYNVLRKVSGEKVISISSADAIGSGVTYSARVQVLSVVDSQITAGKPATVKSSAGPYGAIAVLTESKAMAVYLQSSNYVQARVLEIGV